MEIRQPCVTANKDEDRRTQQVYFTSKNEIINCHFASKGRSDILKSLK